MSILTGMAAPAAGALAVPRPGESNKPNQQTETREHLRVAPDRRRARLRTRLLMLGIAFVTVASLFTLVGFRVVAAQSAFTLDQLSKVRTNEQLRYERLREEVARRSSPAAIIAAARAQGMDFANRKIFISAPAAAPRAGADTTKPPTSGTSYEKTKQALDQNP